MLVAPLYRAILHHKPETQPSVYKQTNTERTTVPIHLCVYIYIFILTLTVSPPKIYIGMVMVIGVSYVKMPHAERLRRRPDNWHHVTNWFLHVL